MSNEINLSTKKSFLKKYFLQEKGIIPPLCEELSKDDLISLIKIHNGTIYDAALYEYIAFHKNVTEEIHDHLINITNNASWIGNAIATSGKASINTLTKLLNHESNFVREHAKLALDNP